MRDIPLHEITLRKYEKPNTQDERELIRLLCLSLGLLQPGDSRDVVVDVFHVLLQAKQQKNMLTIEAIETQVMARRGQQHEGATGRGIAASNIRRQVRKLRDMYLVEKIKTNYRITEFLPLNTLFSKKTIPFIVAGILERIEEQLTMLDGFFGDARQ